jgi:hypothetical protein
MNMKKELDYIPGRGIGIRIAGFSGIIPGAPIRGARIGIPGGTIPGIIPGIGPRIPGIMAIATGGTNGRAP